MDAFLNSQCMIYNLRNPWPLSDCFFLKALLMLLAIDYNENKPEMISSEPWLPGRCFQAILSFNFSTLHFDNEESQVQRG